MSWPIGQDIGLAIGLLSIRDEGWQGFKKEKLDSQAIGSPAYLGHLTTSLLSTR
jgi:hypothetical protein